MAELLMAKFSQNSDLAKILLNAEESNYMRQLEIASGGLVVAYLPTPSPLNSGK